MNKITVKQKGLVMEVSPFMAKLIELRRLHSDVVRKQIWRILRREALKIDKEIRR